MIELVELAEGYKFDSLLIEVRDDYRVCCKECSNWINAEFPSAKINHSRKCFSEPQLIAPPRPKPIKRDPLAKVAKDHKAGYNVDPDEVYDAYRAGYLTMSEAMNSDF